MTDPVPEFKKFLSTCSSLLKGESPQFLGLIRKRYDSCSETFRTSSHMVDLLSSTTSKMLSDQKRFFVHLKDFVNELKAWSVEGQAEPSRKRKSESPRESLAKVAKIEDSTSEGSDLEGKLHRVLESGGQTSSAQTTSAVVELVTHQPALSCEPSETTEQDCAESEAKPVPATTTCVATDSDSPTVSTGVVAVTEAERTETLTNNGSGSHDEMPTISPQVAADHCSSNPDSGLSLNTPSSGGLPSSSSSPKLTSIENELQDVVNVRGETTNSQANGSREVCDRDKVNSDPGCLTADGEFGDSTCKSEDVKCSVTSTHISEPVASRSQEAGAICCVKAPPAPNSSTSLEAASPHNKGKSLGDAINRLKTKLISLPPTAATKLSSPKTINGEAVDDSKKMLVKDNKDSLVDDLHSENRRKSKIVSKVSSKRPEPSTSSGGKGEHAHSRSKEPEAEEEVEGGGKESKYVRRLERLLEKIRDEIEKVRERDLSLDDLDAEDSAYIYEDRLQKKFVKVWERLCKLRGSSTASGRPVERKFKYQGTRFPEINRKIEKFVNRPNTFPDYHDIRGIIKKVNTRCHLGLNVMQINSISKETFMDVGEALQRRRKADFISTFHSKQTLPCSNEEDPALFDSELRIKLEQNQQIGRTRLEGVIRKYTDLQLALGDVDKDEIEREASSTNCSLKSRADPHAKSLSDHRYKSPSRPRSESPSDRQRKSPSRPGPNSPLDNLSKSPSDHRSKSPSVGRSKSPSDHRSKSPSISRSKSPSDHRSKSPSISRSKSPSVSRSKSPSVSRSKSPSISRSKSPSMSRSKSPSVSRSKSSSDHDLNLAVGQFSNAPSIDDEELNEELNDETEEQASSQVMKKAKVVLMDCMKEEEEEEEDMEEEDDDDAEEEEEVEEEDVEEEEEDMDEDVEDEMSMIEMDIAEECHLLMGDDSQDDSDWQHQPGNSTTSWQPEGGNTASWQGDYDDSVSEWPELAGERVIEPSGYDVSCSALPNDDRSNVSEVDGDGSVRMLDLEGAESQSEWGEEQGGSCAHLLESPRQVSETLPEQSENKARTSQPEGSGGKLGREGQVGVGWREEEGDSPTVWIEENEDSCEQPQNASTPPSASVDGSTPCVGADRTAGSATTSGVEHRLAAGEDIVNTGGKRRRRLEDLQQDEVQEREITEVYEDRRGNSAGSDGVKIEVDVDRGEDAGSCSALGRSDCSVAQNRSPGVFFQSDVIDLDAGSLDTDKEGVVETDRDSHVVGQGREGVRTVQGGDSVGGVEQTRHNCVEKDGQNSATKHSQDDVISHSVSDNGGDTLQAAGSDQSPCSISRTHSPNTVSSLKTGSLHLIKKSNSPVKINPDLRLPAYLQQRNSEACTSKADAVFYPDRVAPSYAYSEQNGDSITIGSSDEETEVRPDVKPTVCAKTEPKSAAGPDDGEVIVLSDDD